MRKLTFYKLSKAYQKHYYWQRVQLNKYKNNEETTICRYMIIKKHQSLLIEIQVK